MNVKNRKMFRPKNAGKQAAGILASSPQLMQSVQRRYLGGNVRTRNTILPDAAIDQTFMRPPMNLQQAAARSGSLGVRSRNTMLPDAAIDQTFMRPPVNLQQAATTPFSFLTPKGSQAVSNIGRGIGSALSRLGTAIGTGSTRQRQAQADLEAQRGIGFEDLLPSEEIGGSQSYRPGTFVPPITELDIADADDAATIITDADREDAEAGMLPSEQLATSTVSGQKTQVDEAPPTDQEQEQPNQGSEKAETSGSSLAATQTRLNKFAQDQSTKGSSDVKPQVNTPEQAALPEAGAALNELLSNKPTLESATFSDVEESVKEMMGFDPDKASEDKKDAIYMNMMMAGLAMASGESPNALTNIANGLRAGLAGYAKDIKDIDERDAELQKEFRASMRDAVKNENDVRKAQATLDSSYNTTIANIKANQENTLAGITSREGIAANRLAFDEQVEATNNAYRQQTFELAIINAQNTLDINLEELGLQRETLDFNKQKEIYDKFFRQAELQLNSAPEEAIQAAYLGPGFAIQNEDGTFSLTDKGRETYSLLLSASLADPDDQTDLDKRSIALAKVFDGTAGSLDIAYAMGHPAFTNLNKEIQNPEETFRILKMQQQPATGDGFGTELSVN